MTLAEIAEKAWARSEARKAETSTVVGDGARRSKTTGRVRKRPIVVGVCGDCGGRTSADRVKRCKSCANLYGRSRPSKYE